MTCLTVNRDLSANIILVNKQPSWRPNLLLDCSTNQFYIEDWNGTSVVERLAKLVNIINNNHLQEVLFLWFFWPLIAFYWIYQSRFTWSVSSMESITDHRMIFSSFWFFPDPKHSHVIDHRFSFSSFYWNLLTSLLASRCRPPGENKFLTSFNDQTLSGSTVNL